MVMRCQWRWYDWLIDDVDDDDDNDIINEDLCYYFYTLLK